jgi:hypothetical protein
VAVLRADEELSNCQYLWMRDLDYAASA